MADEIHGLEGPEKQGGGAPDGDVDSHSTCCIESRLGYESNHNNSVTRVPS